LFLFLLLLTCVRLHKKVVEPYETAKGLHVASTNLHATLVVLRAATRYLHLSRRLALQIAETNPQKVNVDSLALLRAAKTVSELCTESLKYYTMAPLISFLRLTCPLLLAVLLLFASLYACLTGSRPSCRNTFPINTQHHTIPHPHHPPANNPTAQSPFNTPPHPPHPAHPPHPFSPDIPRASPLRVRSRGQFRVTCRAARLGVRKYGSWRGDKEWRRR